MALAATTVWEFDTTGANAAKDNGGGFNASRSGAGTDYSLNANTPNAAGGPILDSVVGAMTAGGTTFTTAAGGDHFSAAMIGNLLCIHAGTNVGAVPLWAEITAYTDEHTVTIDRDITSGGNASDVHFKVGGCLDTTGGTGSTDAIFEAAAVTGGNIFYIKGGAGPLTYTLGANVSVSADGLLTAPHQIIGYSDTRAVWGVCDTTNRPIIACGTNTLIFGDYWHKMHLVITTSATAGLSLGDNAYVRNCKSTQGGTGTKYACTTGVYSRIVDCEFIYGVGSAIAVAGNGLRLLYSWVHDSVTGVYVAAGSGVLVGTIIETCTTASINLTTKGSWTIINCTIDNADSETGDGILASTAEGLIAFNLIISNFDAAGTGHGAKWTTRTDDNRWDYNDFFGNDVDIELVANRHATLMLSGPNDMDADPLYTAANDFSLQSGSTIIDAGFKIRLGVGV